MLMSLSALTTQSYSLLYGNFVVLNASHHQNPNQVKADIKGEKTTYLISFATMSIQHPIICKTFSDSTIYFIPKDCESQRRSAGNEFSSCSYWLPLLFCSCGVDPKPADADSHSGFVAQSTLPSTHALHLHHMCWCRCESSLQTN